MKKILLLLLFTAASYSQAVFDEGIQITGNANSATATKVNVQEANGKVNTQTINTGFNKNFGTTAGTVVEGNDSRILNGQTAFSWGNHASAGYALTTGSNINQASFRTALGLGSNAYTSTAYQPANNTLFKSLGILQSNVNANTIVGNGYYLNVTGNGTGNSNFPLGYGTVSVIGNNTDDYSQIQTAYYINGEHYVRSRWAGNYTPWRKVWDDANFNPANYLPLSGGTLSGAISGTSATFSSTISASPATTSDQVPTWGQVQAMASSGTYTPSNQTNAAQTVNFIRSYWEKNGNVLTVTTSLTYTVTQIQSTSSFLITLPNGFLVSGVSSGRIIGSSLLHTTQGIFNNNANMKAYEASDSSKINLQANFQAPVSSGTYETTIIYTVLIQ